MEGPAVSVSVQPSDAVEVDGDGVGEVAADHAAAEGAAANSSTGLGSPRSLQEMLLSTEPSRPLDQVESLWDPTHGGRARITRGIQKAVGADGVPAIVDIGIGVLEEVLDVDDLQDGDVDGGEDGEDTGRPELDDLAGV